MLMAALALLLTAWPVAAQGGNESAWRQLFESHFDAVYRFCLTLTARSR